jgi:hypothetical protein
MIERVRQRKTSRLAGAFDLMVATAQVFSPDGITRGFVSFRSHAEAFLNAWPEGQDLRPHWDHHYTQPADALTAQVRTVVAELDGHADSAGEFFRYRLVLNYRHLHFTRLALTPAERFLLCHLTANAVEDSYGISAVDQLTSPEAAEQLTARKIP